MGLDIPADISHKLQLWETRIDEVRAATLAGFEASLLGNIRESEKEHLFTPGFT
jgi:hypothetical protein